jgi:Flp pilus assembly CpaF family ATPase
MVTTLEQEGVGKGNKMALRERYVKDRNGSGTSPAAEEGIYGNQAFQEMKARLHRAIISRMDLTKLNTLAPDRVQAEVSRLAEDLLLAENTPLSTAERDRLVNEVHHELFGLGPLEPLLSDGTISDILVNSYSSIYIERRGKLEKTSISFRDDEQLRRVIERIVTIEDSAELQLQQPHVVRLETRPPNIEGRGEVAQRDLVRNALRMRPDRIVIGEVRGGEAIDMLQAMNTGHDGSLTTIHANSPRDALSRLETMIQMTGMRLSDRAMRQQIASAVNVVIQVARLNDGTRRIVSISEITGMEGETIAMQEIFQFERTGLDGSGKVLGRFRTTGIRPRFAERFQQYGMQLPAFF